MGNTSKRTTSCLTCRRRRIKCDQTRPVCKRCERSGVECNVSKDVAFIGEEKEKVSRPRRPEKRANTLTKLDPVDKSWMDRKIALPAPADLKGFEIQTTICYTRKYLLRGGPVDVALEDLQFSDISTVGEGMREGQLLHRAILSLAMIFFGNQHAKSSIRDRGFVMYGVTLKQLNHALSDPKCFTRDDVLLSVAALALREIFIPTGRKFYLRHMIGLEKLLELRGPPTSDYSPKAFRIYKGIRRMITFASLAERKPSILAREEWKSIPWTNLPDDEVEEQYLFHALADCTVVMVEHDKIIANHEPDAEDFARQRDKVARKAEDLLEKLHLWRSQWDSKKRKTHSKTGTSYPALPAIQETTMLMLYNTAVIYTLQTLVSLPPRFSDSSFNQHEAEQHSENSQPLKPPEQDATDDYAADIESACLEICHYIPYYLSMKSHLDASSSSAAHLAVKTALMALGGSSSPKGRWVMNLLNIKGNENFAKVFWVD